MGGLGNQKVAFGVGPGRLGEVGKAESLVGRKNSTGCTWGQPCGGGACGLPNMGRSRSPIPWPVPCSPPPPLKRLAVT